MPGDIGFDEKIHGGVARKDIDRSHLVAANLIPKHDGTREQHRVVVLRRGWVVIAVVDSSGNATREQQPRPEEQASWRMNSGHRRTYKPQSPAILALPNTANNTFARDRSNPAQSPYFRHRLANSNKVIQRFLNVVGASVKALMPLCARSSL